MDKRGRTLTPYEVDGQMFMGITPQTPSRAMLELTPEQRFRQLRRDMRYLYREMEAYSDVGGSWNDAKNVQRQRLHHCRERLYRRWGSPVTWRMVRTIHLLTGLEMAT